MTRGSSSPKARLKEYRAKRDFTKTPEPSSAKPTKKKTKSLYFCVQKHLASHLHYDFRLEHKGVLLSWAVPKGPSLNPADKRLAMRVEDHPFDYGEFEGVIPEGYGAGIVVLWDKGAWHPQNGDVDAALEKGELKFTLAGAKLKGSWLLVRTGGRYGSSGRAWLLIKHRDQWSGDVDITAMAPWSVKSAGDFADVLAAEIPSVWESHRPAKGGDAGKMFADLIAKATEIKLAQEKPGRRGAAKKKATKRKAAARK